MRGWHRLEASSNRGTISTQHRPPMYHLTPVLKAMTLSPIRAIIHLGRLALPSPSLSVPADPLAPSRALLAFLAGREARPRNVLANALRAGPAFLDFSFALRGITDRPAGRDARVKLSPRIRARSSLAFNEVAASSAN